MMTNGNTRKLNTVVVKKESPEMAYFEDIHSPTDSSEDSVEVKISPISLRHNKRKLAEPRKLQDSLPQGPLKKRMCFKVKAEEPAPFRPWSPAPPATPPPLDLRTEERADEPAETVLLRARDAFPPLEQRRDQRNYKNMTRERRIEANARERTRVHTISAAFDTLRKSIPSYSHNQKLSKLSVLRIACSYIMTLSSIVTGDDEGMAESVEMVTKTIQREGKLRKKKDDND